MVTNKGHKVLNSPRTLERRPPGEEKSSQDSSILPIRVVSIQGCDSELVTTVKKFESHLLNTHSFSCEKNTQTQPTPHAISNQNPKLFQFVKKTGPNLKSRLVQLKSLAVGNRYIIWKNGKMWKKEL